MQINSACYRMRKIGPDINGSPIMSDVCEIMASHPATLGPEDTLEAAWNLMRSLHIRHVPVLKDDRVVGLVTQKDLMASLTNVNFLTLPVAEIMVSNVQSVAPDTTLSEAATILYDRKISCLPVVDPAQNVLIGMVTESDYLALAVRMLKREEAIGA